jgi:putative two-component system response regulator
MTRILVIDDEPVLRELMREMLEQAGYDVAGAEDAEHALALLEDEKIGLVVCDILMPGLTGIELLETVHRQQPNLPVLLVTGADTHAHLAAALAGGAAGLVAKPFSSAELVRTVALALERSSRARRDLQTRLLTPTLAGALANAIEAREASLHGHCERLAALAVCLGAELGLGRTELETVRVGAILHDIGKIGIPDSILLKEASLDANEFALMKEHALIGDRMLEPLELLEAVRPIVRHHHERWDGAGYPDGLAGDRIPHAARIVAVADAVEAMSANRPYRSALPAADIWLELRSGRARQWDPDVVDALLRLVGSGELRIGAEGLELYERGGEGLDRRKAA